MIPPVPCVLKVERLEKSFGDVQAVNGVSFHVAPGEIVGLLGPNGAGKTTTINMILGVLEPSAGRIEIEGVDLAADRTKALSCTNFAAVYAPLPGNLTVEQNLRVFGMLYAVRDLSARIEKLLKVYDLVRYRRTKAGVLSSGEQTRLSLAKAMLNKPRLLLLDEPTASIDPSNARDIRAGIAKFVDNGILRRVVDEPQHVRGAGRLRSGAVPVAWADRARGRSEDAARRAWRSDPRRSVRQCRARGAAREQPMNASRIGAIVLRMFYLYRGSPQRIFPIFIFVAIDILVWGFLTRYLNSVSHADFNFVPALLGAVLLWDFLTRVMQQITMTLFEDVWTRNFLNFFASPLRTSEYLIGLLIVAIITSGLSLVAMLVLAQMAFGLSFLSYGLPIAPFLMVLFITGIALGIAASALVLRLGPASEWLIWPIPMLISPFAGVFYPVTVLPGWMQAIALLLPPAYVFEGMRSVVAGQGAPWDRLAIGGALALLYLVLACMFFFAVYRAVIRNGLIARYSAETVS